MSHSLPVTTAADASGTNPNGYQLLGATDFTAVLHVLASEGEVQSVRAPAVRQLIPAPVLCPRPDSLVRFMPLAGAAAPSIGSLGSIWVGDDAWTFVDFAAFEGADFAYAVCRCLLHGAASKKQVAAVESGSLEARLMLLLAADRKARRMVSGGRLVNLGGTRALYGAYRTARKLKLAPVALLLRKCLAWRARIMFDRQRDLIVQRRWMLSQLNILSGRR